MKNKLLVAFTLLFGATALWSCSDDKDDGPQMPSAPSKVTEAFAQKFPEASNPKWEQKYGYYIADFADKARNEVEAWFKPDGTWAMTETDYGKNLFMIPANIERAFALGEYGSWTVDDIDHYQRTADEFYVIEVEKAGKPDMALFYATDASLIKAVPETGVEIMPSTSL